jgi:molybdate transport system ATP-binding protein
MSFSIEVEKRLGTRTLRLAFETGAGITGVFGPSGAGKTSLLNLVAGALRPDHGRIAVAGHVLFDGKRAINLRPERRHAGYIFQDGRLFPHMSVRANLRYGMAGGRAPALSFDETVACLGVAHLLDRRPAALSGGEAQRVAIGRALLAGPDFLLMDEPLSSLDRERREEILRVIERLRDRFALPILYVSHDLAEVERLCDHIVLTRDLTVVAAGPIGTMLADLTLPFAREPAAAMVVNAGIVRHDADYDLTECRIDGATLQIPGRLGAPGETRRLRILARDVSLATGPAARSSVLNVLPATIAAVEPLDRSHVVVLLDVGGARLLSAITRKSRDGLALAIGQAVLAQIKAVALADDRTASARPR